jgi:hypothetical protein
MMWPRYSTITVAYLLLASLDAAAFVPPISQSRVSSTTPSTEKLILRAHGPPNLHEDDATLASADQQQQRTEHTLDRRSLLSSVAACTLALVANPDAAQAEITADSMWPLWTALPVAPYSRRRTLRKKVADGVWTFDQLIGIYYVHVPIRMTVVRSGSGGLLVYAPVAPTKECLSLLQELINQYGPIQYIILPSVAVEHKVNAGPFARQFPNAEFYVTDRQYSFPVALPSSFLGLPRWTKPLPTNAPDLFGKDIDYEILTVKPGPGSQFQDMALFHRPSKTMLICDAIFATTSEPPAILTEEPEYTRALLFQARDSKDDIVIDTPENRRKGWRRIVLLFNFFFPTSGTGNLGPGPVLEALKTPGYKDGWGGWRPFSWKDSELDDFERFSAGGRPTILPIIQIILARGPKEVSEWLEKVTKWNFVRVIPAHLDSPLAIGPTEFAEAFDFVKSGRNEVRFCDEDVSFLRKAEEGVLGFSVYPTSLGVLRGKPCNFE